MSAITWSDVSSYAPSIGSVESDAQTEILEYVNNLLDVSKFGGEESPKVRMARLNLAAHLGMVSASGGNANVGDVVSESAGGLSRTYAANAIAASGGAGSLGTTSYGAMYLHIIRTSAARIPFVVGGR